jgi:anti-anti-sigma regulatory factor
MATAALSASSHHLSIGRRTDIGYRREVRAMIVNAVRAGTTHVVVDCGSWIVLDLGVLSALIQGAKVCAEYGVEFELTNLRGTVRSSIEALRLSAQLGLGPGRQATLVLVE